MDLGGTAVKLNATLLDANTEEHEHRFGAGARFSTLAAYERGAARLPLEVSFAHYQSVAGSGGATPRLSVDQVRVTVYRRLFGR